jgi:hypothetical protein
MCARRAPLSLARARRPESAPARLRARAAAEAKREDLVARFEELKKAGRLEAFMAKRRAKLASKDHVLMPHERRGGE